MAHHMETAAGQAAESGSSLAADPDNIDQANALSQANLAEHVAEIRRLGRRVIADVVEIGKRLTECKKIVGHGGWGPWLLREFGWTDDSALNFMRVYDLSKSRKFRDLNLPVSAIYLLARPSTPDEVRDDIIERAKAGEVVSVEAVREMVVRHQPAKKAPSEHSLAVLTSSKSVEWYTPAGVVEQVTAVLGGIDLDPCWHPESPVKATTTYVEQQDGLSREWNGRVYLNPPYGRDIDGWIEKLVGEHEAGRVTEAIALVPARVETEWFRRLDAYPRCFLYGRVTFANAENPAAFPNAVVYLGNDVAKFSTVFEPAGGIWVRLERPAPASQVDDDLGGIPPFLRRIAS
jgi:hypothetical protein